MTRDSFVLPWTLFLFLFFGAAVWRWRRTRARKVVLQHLRGRKLQEAGNMRERFPRTDDTFQLGACHLPHRLAYGHIAVVGATGSGKTILQRLLMQSVLPQITPDSNQRALIYDAKQDVLSILGGMKLQGPIHLLNPLDSRSSAWDIAQDITSPAAALQFASLLIPKAQHDANPFFSNAARHLLYGVLIAYILYAPKSWTLRHVLLALRQEKLLREVLSLGPQTRDLLQYFDQSQTFQNILSTLLTRTAPYEIIAAAWDRSRTKISLKDWVRQPSILVLGNDEENRTALDTLNQMVFKRLTELVLGQEESQGDRTTWFFLDEIRQAGKLEGLSALMTKGRSKGAAVLMGFQDINGLRDVYGRQVADELVGQCNTKAILRLNSPETGRWASQVVGAAEFVETRRSQSRSRNFRETGLHAGGSSGESTSSSITKRDLILDSEFLDLPETSFESGLSGVLVSPVTGVFQDHLPGPWLRSHLLSPNPRIPNFHPRPDSDQYLEPWSNRDADFLNSHPRSSRSLHAVS